MEIKINVNDDQVADILEKEIAALKPDELHDIFVQCVKEYFTVDNYKNLEKLLFSTNNYYRHTELTPFAHSLVTQCDYSKAQEVVDASIDYLQTHHEKLMIDVMKSMIYDNMCRSNAFNDAVRVAINTMNING